MNLRTPILAFAAVSALGGCVHLQPIVEKTATHDPATGYVGGTFVTEGGAFTYGFGIIDAVGHQWVLPFADPSGNGSKYLNGKMVGFIALPPGDYRVGSWVKGAMDRSGKPIPETDAVGRPFTLKPGHVVYLGSFSARTTSTMSGSMIYTHFSVVPLPIRADEVWTTVTGEYAAFADAPVECLLCKAPPADATRFAGPVPTNPPDFSHQHDVIVHVFRPDRQYATTGLTAWESFEGKKDQREVFDASWKLPQTPVRTDTFGAVFVVNDLNFKNGRVNFVVRDPERAQAPMERSFLLREAREVWVNHEDPNVYLSEKDATAARRE